MSHPWAMCDRCLEWRDRRMLERVDGRWVHRSARACARWRARMLALAEDVRFQPITQDGREVGFLTHHRASWSPSGWCSGYVRFEPDPARPNAPVWTLESREPLTLSPSIHCRNKRNDGSGAECGWHGFAREGRWVPV